VEPGDPGRFFEHHAPLGRLGGNDGGDAPWLTRAGLWRRSRHRQRRARHRGAHVAAIDAIGRARAAFDAPDDFEIVAMAAGRFQRPE
jgi:hypothetical protein